MMMMLAMVTTVMMVMMMTIDGDYGDDGDDGDDGDLLAPAHQEGSSVSRPSPPRPTPAHCRLSDGDHKK